MAQKSNIRPALYDELDDASFPSIAKFFPPDTFREIIEQPAPDESEICVAFPLQHAWQTLEDLVKENKAPSCSLQIRLYQQLHLTA